MIEVKSKSKIILPLLLLLINGCTVVKTVTVEKPMYIEDLNYTSDTNYSITTYNLLIEDGQVEVPIETMQSILERSNYYKKESIVKDKVINSYRDLIRFNNDLAKGATHETVEQ